MATLPRRVNDPPCGTRARVGRSETDLLVFRRSTFAERKLTARDVSVHVNGDAAWVEFYWHFVGKQRKDGATIQTDGRETQIYQKTGDRWQLVHVHYSGPATTQ